MSRFKKSPETIELNESLEIVDIAGLKWKNPLGYQMASKHESDRWAFKTPKGYISDNGHYPYCPVGGKKALQQIIDGGGYADFEGVHFIMPMEDE